MDMRHEEKLLCQTLRNDFQPVLHILFLDGSQDHWDSGLCPLSRIINTVLENTTFRQPDLLPSSGEGEKTLLCWVQWLRLDVSKGPNWAGVSPLTWRWKKNSFEMLCFLVFRIPKQGTKSRNPLIQNPLDSPSHMSELDLLVSFYWNYKTYKQSPTLTASLQSLHCVSHASG
jgi:hypothetical protein